MGNEFEFGPASWTVAVAAAVATAFIQRMTFIFLDRWFEDRKPHEKGFTLEVPLVMGVFEQALRSLPFSHRFYLLTILCGIIAHQGGFPVEGWLAIESAAIFYLAWLKMVALLTALKAAG